VTLNVPFMMIIPFSFFQDISCFAKPSQGELMYAAAVKGGGIRGVSVYFCPLSWCFLDLTEQEAAFRGAICNLLNRGQSPGDKSRNHQTGARGGRQGCI
jgi:hypothetical protein